MANEAVESTAPVSRAAPEKEYFLSGGESRYPLSGGYHTISSHLKQLTERAGPWLADQMFLDEKIAGSVRTIKDGVLSQGMQITATVNIDPEDSPDDLTQDDIDLAFQIEDHCERCRRNMQGSWMELLRRMMDAMGYRTMMAEVVRRVAEGGPDDGLYVLDRIPVKDSDSWRFVIDSFGHVRGIEGNTIKPDGSPDSRIFPRDKFIILPWLPRGSRPWGQGLFGEAYNPWNFKVQLYPLLWKYLQQFAIPTTHASPPEGVHNQKRKAIGIDGKPTGEEVPSTVALYNELQAMLSKGGSLVVTPPGTTLDLKVPAGNGAVFQLVFDMLDRAIVFAMHNTTRASMESTRSSRSDAETGQDLLGLVVSYGKWALKEMLENDLWRPHVAMNWGDEVAARFTPEVSFGMTNPEDFSRNSNAVYRLYSVGLISGEERTDALRFLGLNFGRRKKSSPQAELTTDPAPGTRAVNVRQRGAA